MNKFDERLRELRKEKELSQQQLSEVFNVSKMTISAWETSKQEPSIELILSIATFFNVSTDYLLGNED